VVAATSGVSTSSNSWARPLSSWLAAGGGISLKRMHGAAHLTQYIGVLGRFSSCKPSSLSVCNNSVAVSKKSSRSSEARSSGKKTSNPSPQCAGRQCRCSGGPCVSIREAKEALGVSNEQISFWVQAAIELINQTLLLGFVEVNHHVAQKIMSLR